MSHKEMKKTGNKIKKSIKGKGSKTRVRSKVKSSASAGGSKKKENRIKSKTKLCKRESKSKVMKSSSKIVNKSASKSGDKSANKAKIVKFKVSPEIVANNKAMLEKIILLMEKIRVDQITRDNKDDLDKIQQLIKNIAFRDGGEPTRAREVQLSEHQKAIIKMISGDASLDESDHLMMTVTDSKDARAFSKADGKLNYQYEKLEFVPTKANN